MKNFQGKNRDADVENEPVDAREEGKGGTNWKIKIYINTLSQFSQFSGSVVSDSLRPHESQHTRLPCPSPIPKVHPNPCPSSR